MAKNLTEKQQLIRGWTKRIAFQKKQLKNTRLFHVGIENKIVRRIRQSEMTLKALKRTR